MTSGHLEDNMLYRSISHQGTRQAKVNHAVDQDGCSEYDIISATWALAIVAHRSYAVFDHFLRKNYSLKQCLAWSGFAHLQVLLSNLWASAHILLFAWWSVGYPRRASMKGRSCKICIECKRGTEHIWAKVAPQKMHALSDKAALAAVRIFECPDGQK